MKKWTAIHNLLIILIVAGYVWMTMRLYFSGKITYYVHPDFAFLDLISGIFLAIVLFLLIVSLGSKTGRATLSNSFSQSKFKFIMSVLPLVLFFIFQPKTLSSQAFATRSITGGGDVGLSRQVEKPAEFVINTEKRELIDWIRLFSENAEPDVYAGMKVHLTGFVIKDGTLPENYFTVARFVVSCCAADARPIGLPVKYDASKFDLKSDEWIDMNGHFEVDEVDGQRQPVIVLTEAKKIEIPANPYVS